MTPDRRKEIEDALDKATPGRWKAFIKDNTISIYAKKIDQIIHWTGFDACGEPLSQQKHNAKLIANAPTYISELLSALKEREDEVGRLKAKIKRLKDIYNEEGLVDPGLEHIAGKSINVFETAAAPEREFDPTPNPSETNNEANR